MGKSLQHVGFRDRLKVNRVLRPIRDEYGDITYDEIRARRSALEEAVSLLEAAADASPGEWILWYILGDFYEPLGDFVKSVRAGERCYELRPKDPRSPCALATNLRTLTHAKYLGQQTYIEPRRTLHEQLAARGYFVAFDPDKSQQALEELGLSLDQAAERSLRLFEEVLSLGVPEAEAIEVRNTLAAMYSEFPHLEDRVRSTRVAPRGPFAVARGDPFNEAVEHYQKLRYLWQRPDALIAELLEVIRLTQIGLAKDRYNGDAMVLLAHALLLSSHQAVLLGQQGYEYFLLRSAAVIEHWSSAPARTINRDNGEMVRWRIQTEIEQPEALTTRELQRRLHAGRGVLLKEAFDPHSLPAMQRFIRGDKTT